MKKFGVRPASIPDWLALVGDSADGFPGLPGWGAASAAGGAGALRAPGAHSRAGRGLGVSRCAARRGWPRRSPRSASTRCCSATLATLRADAPIGADVDALRWVGPRPDFAAWAERLGPPSLQERAAKLAEARARPSTA